jgi:hypothetical protein
MRVDNCAMPVDNCAMLTPFMVLETSQAVGPMRVDNVPCLLHLWSCRQARLWCPRYWTTVRLVPIMQDVLKSVKQLGIQKMAFLASYSSRYLNVDSNFNLEMFIGMYPKITHWKALESTFIL